MCGPAGKSALSLFVLALYLFVMALAASPELHHLFNHDADSPDHQCAATVIAQGQIDATVAAVTLTIPAVVFEQSRPAEPRYLASPEVWLPPERAPPASRS